jgi:hypothetical protein
MTGEGKNYKRIAQKGKPEEIYIWIREERMTDEDDAVDLGQRLTNQRKGWRLPLGRS